VVQSLDTLHTLPGPHGAHDPPQSTSDSVAPFVPSLQVLASQTWLLQMALSSTQLYMALSMQSTHAPSKQ
jgi:hypothetical protein